jgi:hypothetical protein
MTTPTPEQLQKDTAAMFEHVANFGSGPAHPQQIQYGMTDGVPNIWFAVGMTKRERFAMAAMQGMLSNPVLKRENQGEGEFIDMVTGDAVMAADSLLERLKK